MKSPLRFAAIQIAASELVDHERTLRHSLDLIDQAADAGADLIGLPECTYPAYFLHSPEEPARLGVLRGRDAVEVYAAKARERRVHLAVGMAYIEDDGSISNSAALIGPDGEQIGRYSKSLLWHFDSQWFSCGREYPVFETELGRIGIFICADGRQPEITRAIALQEPHLIVDLTAWVSWGRDRATLTSPQPDHLLPVRAAENGVWIAAAGKCGEEAGSILYCGSSCLVSPAGEVVARASSDREEVPVWDVLIGQAAKPYVERRPELYGGITRPTDELPVVRLMAEPAPSAAVMVAAAQRPAYKDGRDLLNHARAVITTGRTQGVSLFVLPAYDPALADSFSAEELTSKLSRGLEDGEILVAALAESGAGGFYRTVYALGARGVLAGHRQTHLGRHNVDAGTMAGSEAALVFETPLGRMGLMAGAEGYVPEVARCLMLEGAEIIAWVSFEPSLAVLPFAQARAEENRVFVVAAATNGPLGGAVIADPGGRVVASAPLDSALTVSALINPAMARWKERAPGTDVVLSRQPETYGALVAAPTPIAV
ncbi:MAG: carbon-nitrogen hydrolase family protein [Dehalococcoidia bacterium]